MTLGKPQSPGRYAAKAKSDRVGLRALPGDREAWEERGERLDQLEETLARHETILQKLVATTEAIRERLEQQVPRRPTPRAMPAVDLVPMKDEDMMIGGQYLFRVANPQRPFMARAVIINAKEDPKTGATMYNFVRGDTGRTFQPRVATEFFKLPDDWKDPADAGEEDEGSVRPAPRLPQSSKSTRPNRR